MGKSCSTPLVCQNEETFDDDDLNLLELEIESNKTTETVHFHLSPKITNSLTLKKSKEGKKYWISQVKKLTSNIILKKEIQPYFETLNKNFFKAKILPTGKLRNLLTAKFDHDIHFLDGCIRSRFLLTLKEEFKKRPNFELNCSFSFEPIDVYISKLQRITYDFKENKFFEFVQFFDHRTNKFLISRCEDYHAELKELKIYNSVKTFLASHFEKISKISLKIYSEKVMEIEVSFNKVLFNEVGSLVQRGRPVSHVIKNSTVLDGSSRSKNRTTQNIEINPKSTVRNLDNTPVFQDLDNGIFKGIPYIGDESILRDFENFVVKQISLKRKSEHKGEYFFLCKYDSDFGVMNYATIEERFTIDRIDRVESICIVVVKFEKIFVNDFDYHFDVGYFVHYYDLVGKGKMQKMWLDFDQRILVCQRKGYDYYYLNDKYELRFVENWPNIVNIFEVDEDVLKLKRMEAKGVKLKSRHYVIEKLARVNQPTN
jgi:hypothetical protein